MKEVLSVASDFGKAAHLKEYGWAAVGFAILSMLVYVCALMCSHLAAFRVQANIRTSLMRHILTLPMGFLDKDGTGKTVKSSMNPAQQQRPIWRTSYRIRQEPSQHRQVFLVLLMVFDFLAWSFESDSCGGSIFDYGNHDRTAYER